MESFKGKIVVITGAGSGIGKSLALEFGKLGAKLALNDYNHEGLSETCQILQKDGYDQIYFETFDVSDNNDFLRFAENIKNKWGNAHVIINNAGIAGGTKPSFITPLSEYKKVMEINFFGVLNGTKAFLPQLVANNEGAIVNLSSVMGLIGYPSLSDYCASKFAIRGYTESLALEFHSSPISIHCVHPGGINTNINESKLNNDVNNDRIARKLLITPPELMAKRIIKGIVRSEPRIVFGNQTNPVRLVSLLPKKFANNLIWKRVKNLLIKKHYKKFNVEP